MELSIYELLTLYEAMRSHEKATEKIWRKNTTDVNMYIMGDSRKLCDKIAEEIDNIINN